MKYPRGAEYIKGPAAAEAVEHTVCTLMDNHLFNGLSSLRAFSVITCGEDHILRDEFVIHNGELGQFDLVHPRHGVVSSPPVELDVICGVAV